MNAKKRLENRIRGWLPQEHYKPHQIFAEKPSAGARFSSATKIRIFARVIIAAVFLPLFAVVALSSWSLTIRVVSYFGIVLMTFALVFIADRIAKRYTQKTPAEVERL